MSWYIELASLVQDLGSNLTLLLQQDADPLKEFAEGIDQASKALNEAVASKEIDKKGDFLGVDFWDNDFWKLVFRFAINTLFLLVIVRWIYYPIARRKDYLFTYVMISILTFFICFTLKKFDLGLGMALGLFAIFGIIRYRTDPIPIKEMTYLFIIIGVSVINALSNRKMSYAELAFTNGVIILATYGLEKLWLLKHETQKMIVFEKIDLIRPDRYDDLMADVSERTGLKINRIEVGKVNFLRDTATLLIYYYEDEQEGGGSFESRGYGGGGDE